MTLVAKHSKVVTIPDDPNYPVGTDEWNADHQISGTVSPGDYGLAPSATTDTTNAGNITGGTLAHARLPVLAASDVGLGSVDNTSDVNKPVSTAQAAAIALKASLAGNNAFTGNMSVGGTTASTSTTTGALTVAGGVGIGGALNVGGTFLLQNAAASTAINTIDISQNWSVGGSTNLLASFSSFGDAPRFVLRRANGTLALPTQSLNGDVLGNIQVRGYMLTGGFSPTGTATIMVSAAENFTSTQQGSSLAFSNTLTGGLTVQTSLKMWGSGGVSVMANTDPGAGIFGVNGSSTITGGLSVGTTQTPVAGQIYVNSSQFLIRNKTSWINGAGVVTATLNNSPSAGNPTKWIPIDDNGTTRYIPAW